MWGFLGRRLSRATLTIAAMSGAAARGAACAKPAGAVSTPTPEAAAATVVLLRHVRALARTGTLLAVSNITREEHTGRMGRGRPADMQAGRPRRERQEVRRTFATSWGFLLILG